jgi:tRNA(Ile)-lysidine synthase
MKDSEADARATIDRAVGALDLGRGARIVVAVSGGADSVALLRSLARVAAARGWTLLVAHVEHGLRGDESLLDAAFVRVLSHRLDLDYKEARIDVMAHATEYGVSVETAARTLRYGALGEMMRVWGGEVIATGHTLNDQAETFLLHLLRGAGTTGLAAMRSRSDLVVRPLLGVDRETILLALQEDGQGYRVDRTNEDERHRRVLIRRRVLPVLRDVQPRADEVLARAASLLADDAALLEEEARQALELARLSQDGRLIVLARATFAALHPALRRAVARQAILAVRRSLKDVTERQINSLIAYAIGDQSAPLELPSGLRVDVTDDVLSLFPRGLPGANAPEDVSLEVPGEVIWAGGTLDVVIEPRPDDGALRRFLAVLGPCHALVDADRIGESIIVGSRRPGDRIRRPGSTGSSSLKKMFVDRKVPRAERRLTPVVRDAEGPIWAVGLDIDERVAIRADSRRIAHLRYRR